ncbi:hypothetical protein [Streptomyces sp. C10-9-1]|uniref:hypothetical protein n=1 Tax=Streptomyces sp. C10-9-1 TaxID=1859285 RepID=UPI003D706C9F
MHTSRITWTTRRGHSRRTGLPEPDLSAKVREGQVCAPCEDNLDWLKIAVTQVDARTSRVYLSGAD